MKKFFIFMGVLLLAQSSSAAPLAAIMTFESMALSSDGVQKQTHFQEFFVRDTNVVWSERIIPTRAQPHEHEHTAETEEKHEHKHNLNFATSGKWLVRDASDKILFRLVRKEDKSIIVPRETEYGTLGFDGVWETAFYLANRASLKTMTRLKQPAAQGATWYEHKNATHFTRILWDEQKEFPRVIESGSLDGLSSSKISMTLTAAPKQLPWQELGDFHTIAYEDLLD